MRVPVRLPTYGVPSSSVETWAAQLPQPGTAFRSVRGGWLERKSARTVLGSRRPHPSTILFSALAPKLMVCR